VASYRGSFLVLDSEDEYDLTSPNGKKAFRDQLAGAAYESDRLSKRVQRGKRLKAMRNEPHVSSRPFGFEPDGVTLRESEASEIRAAAERLLAGETQDRIVTDLNARGVRTSYGKVWTGPSLRQLMLRERNAGRVVHNGAVVGRLPGTAILSEDTYGRLVALYTARRRGRPISQGYELSSLAFCGLCGHHLSGRPRPQLRPYEDGEVRRQYWCQKRPVHGGCGRISVDQRDLDRHVAALVIAILADPRHAEAVEATARATADARQEIEAQLSEAERTADVLAERLGRGEITLRRHDAAATPLDTRIADLRRHLDELDAAPGMEVSAAVVAASRQEWRRRWSVATVGERRNLVRQALRGRRIVVSPADPHDRTNVTLRVTII